MISCRGVFIYALLCVNNIVFGQTRDIREGNENWSQVFYNARITEKVSIGSDVGFRFKELLVAPTQSLIRIGGGYHFDKNVVLNGGYAYFVFYETANDAEIPNYEHRTWQRLSISSAIGKLSILHRYRLEQRWVRRIAADRETLADGYRYNNRFGYQLNIQYPLKGDKIEPKIPYVFASDEIFINFGKEIVYNQFDQNRIFFGLGYQFNKSVGIVAGYMHIWQQRGNGVTFRESHCARVNLIINTDFRK